MYRKAYEASGKRYEGQHSEGDEKERRRLSTISAHGRALKRVAAARLFLMQYGFQQFRLTVEH